MAESQKRTFNREEENCRCDIDAEFDADESERRGRLDVMAHTKLGNEMDDKFLNEIGAVSNTGDEGGAGNSDASKREAITLRANQKGGHSDRDQ